MYLKEFLEQYNDRKIKLYVDMDGVIADYEFGAPRDYDKKRPLYDSINKLKIVAEMPNIDMYVLSATRESDGIEQKNYWLDEYVPFIKRENRVILSRADNNYEKSYVLKANYLKDLERDEALIIVIDDDPRCLKAINETSEDIILLKDTVLVD